MIPATLTRRLSSVLTGRNHSERLITIHRYPGIGRMPATSAGFPLTAPSLSRSNVSMTLDFSLTMIWLVRTPTWAAEPSATSSVVVAGTDHGVWQIEIKAALESLTPLSSLQAPESP